MLKWLQYLYIYTHKEDILESSLPQTQVNRLKHEIWWSKQSQVVHKTSQMFRGRTEKERGLTELFKPRGNVSTSWNIKRFDLDATRFTWQKWLNHSVCKSDPKPERSQSGKRWRSGCFCTKEVTLKLLNLNYVEVRILVSDQGVRVIVLLLLSR